MNKFGRWYLLGGLIIVLIAGVSVARFGLGGNEDTWLCEKGQWIAHGKPQGSPPSAPCVIGFSPIVTTTQAESGDEVILYYQPKQCQQMSWDEWYASIGAKFNSPSEYSYEEIIVAYYAQQGIRIYSVEKIESDKMVCQACDICPTSYSLKITAPNDQAGKLTLAGWMRNENGSQSEPNKLMVP